MASCHIASKTLNLRYCFIVIDECNHASITDDKMVNFMFFRWDE